MQRLIRRIVLFVIGFYLLVQMIALIRNVHEKQEDDSILLIKTTIKDVLASNAPLAALQQQQQRQQQKAALLLPLPVHVLPIENESLILTQNVAPPTSTNEKLLLLWKLGTGGFNNQLQCLDIAATLAIQYNRTLILTDPLGYIKNRQHDHDSINFADVFDTSTAAAVPYRMQKMNRRKEQNPNQLLQFDPNEKFPQHLITDPMPLKDVIEIQCSWGFQLRITPLSHFPHAEKVFFPFHSSYREQAMNVIEQMKRRVSNSHKTKDDFKLLTMHIRRGDRISRPIFNCSSLLGGQYKHTVQSTAGPEIVAACSKKSSQTTFFDRDALRWEHVLSSSSSCQLLGICWDDYDAIFIATNDYQWVRKQVLAENSDKVFLMNDFLVPNTTIFSESVRIMMVEEMILALSDRVLLGFPSSVTDRVLKLRLAEGTWNMPHDAILNETYWQYILNRDFF